MIMASTVKIRIDGRDFNVDAGLTVLKAAEKQGFRIPTLCSCKDLAPFSSCFVCLVEVRGAKGFVPACSTLVSDGMDISIESAVARRARKTALELLVSDHLGDCEAPCVSACPSRVPIRDFLALAAKGEYIKAAQKIRETMPFPGSLGRVCPRFCEKECRRTRVDEAVSICYMKRFVSDMEIKAGGPFMPAPGSPTGKSVGIIGAGPAGLSAAYFLRLQGHDVTIYERQKDAGGMMKWGIPDYRLPPDILAKECGAIIGMGVEVKYGVNVGKDIMFDEISKKHDAVFLAIGAQKTSDMPIEGRTSRGVVSGVEFLDAIAKGGRPEVGDKVIVVGGGNTAMDAARCSVRLGAEVVIVYRRSEKEMPANAFEVEEAKHEGVKFELLSVPVKVREEGGRLYFTCLRMGLGAPDASGRRRPVPIDGSDFIIEADTCITAIGQQVDGSIADNTSLKLTKWGTPEYDIHTMQTCLPGVFVGGDGATGADVAVRAVDAGRRAACSIGQFLRGEKVTGEAVKFNSSMGPLDKVPAEVFAGFLKQQVTRMPMLVAEKRTKTFEEVETGFTVDGGGHEAKRCLGCGCVEADDCKLREYCTEYAVDQNRYAGKRRGYENDSTHPIAVLESGKCINCGICVRLLEEDGSHSLGFIGRGFDTRIKPPFEKLLSETGTAGLSFASDACPTAGIADRKKYETKHVGIPGVSK
ncbi:MAG: hypothetical protein A2583_05085 [Bdellovibrionales bacterium RIFOXYD1_FULL_53_11]|nr:MAG: hypothetical protein A2583_05085 [Bdellovibrionales bacterium RIFOXYD1_FULL_53_11]